MKKSVTVASPAAVSVNNPYVTSSDDEEMEHLRVLVHGLSKVGKTWLAASLSEHWPEGPLSDCVWVSVDQGAINGLKSHGIKVPMNVDINKMLLPGKDGSAAQARNIIDAMPKVSQAVRACVFQGGAKIVVVDTLSALDDKFNFYWSQNCPTTRSGAEDRFAMYRLIGTTHQRFYTDMNTLPAHVIYLTHSKALIETDDKNQKNRQKALSIPGMYDLAPQITGQSALLYTKNVDNIFALVAKPKVGKRNEFERTVFTSPNGGMQANTRFQNCLNPEEPADLRAIFNKIQTAFNA